MQVSAISVQNNNGFMMSNSIGLYNNRFNEQQVADTSFNSLNPYINSKKNSSVENGPMVFDSINQWKNFCHRQILGEKLNIIA